MPITRQTTLLILGVGVITLLIAGCSGPPNCTKPQPYMKAKSYPKLTIPPGLDKVSADDAMNIPKVPDDGPIGQYEQAPANTAPDDPAARCLTTPPPLPKSTIDMSKSNDES